MACVFVDALEIGEFLGSGVIDNSGYTHQINVSADSCTVMQASLGFSSSITRYC